MSALLLKGRRCICHGCGELFNSTSAFEKHRAGPFSPISEADTRRCLTHSQMKAQGMSQTDAGYWITSEWDR